MKVKLLFMNKETCDVDETVIINKFTDLWVSDVANELMINGELSMPSKYVEESNIKGLLRTDIDHFYAVKVVGPFDWLFGRK